MEMALITAFLNVSGNTFGKTAAVVDETKREQDKSNW